MGFHSLASLLYRSNTARLLATSVLLALLGAQVVFVVPMIWSQHQSAVQSVVQLERSRLQTTLKHVAPTTRSATEEYLDGRLVGLTIIGTHGRKVLSRGIAADPSVLHRRQGELSSSRFGTVDANWPVQSGRQSLIALARVDIRDELWGSMLATIRAVTFMLLVSLVGAFVALWGTYRHYIGPLVRLEQRFRGSSKDGLGGSLEPVPVDEDDDLAPLAETFNELIEAQRKAARQVKVKQQYLEFAAHHDPLTHLPNRLTFETTLKQTVASAQRENRRFAIYLVDLDNFKFFNDQYGHLVGDKMVAEIGNRLRTMMRDNDLVARLDGDEFVVIQRDVPDHDVAEDVAQRLMGVATAPFEYRGFTLKSAVSVGISCFPADVHSEQDEELLAEEIVNNASVALQEAKSNGKNQYKFFNESMRSRLTARIRLEQDLKIALQDGQFEVYFQPKINIQTRQITGSEALVRWNHPINGRISPEVFVPVAEEAGLIIDLGEWILRTACRETHRLQQLGFHGLNVAVNISAVQFTDGNLLPMVAKALKDTRLSPELLELEITESAVMHDPEDVILSLHELSQFGMRLAIDDFGTGYSSLAYLKRFPVDTLKIDRAFITDISKDNDDVAIVQAVLGLGKHFNMKVVAEGVEDEEQLDFLRQQGCHLAQGYFIGKPMNIDDYVVWLRQWPHGIQGAPESESDADTGTDDALPRVAGSDVLPLPGIRH